MRNHIFRLLIGILLSGCTEKLDVKPDESQLIPQSIADFQALLDNVQYVNNNMPSYSEAGADNYYITAVRYNALPTNGLREGYVWGDHVFPQGDFVADWSQAYSLVTFSNLVLEGINGISEGRETAAYKNLRGSALFIRSLSFYGLAGLFCKTYDSLTAAVDLGVPLRTTSDINTIFKRASLKETYDLLLHDLKMAIHDLPLTTTYKTRPSKVAAYGLLSRIYLCLRDYDNALKYADSALLIDNHLLDYNTLDKTSAFPFPAFNEEVLLHHAMISSPLIRINSSMVDTTLLAEYEEYDLRKTLFFRPLAGGGTLFRGTYTGAVEFFSGIAVDEIYLNRAECFARKGDITNAMKDLNTLLVTRWKTGTYVNKTAQDPEDALRQVLAERRKELLFRGLRFSDLRRLNREPRFAKTLVRTVNGKVYQLPPGDPRYVYLIPDDEIQISGIQQNIR